MLVKRLLAAGAKGSVQRYRPPSIARRPPIASGSWRQLHVAKTAENGKMIEPILPPETDQFQEMMDDRTNALLKTLGYDEKCIEEQVEKPVDNEIGSITPAKHASLVAAVDIKSKPAQPATQSSMHYFDTQEVYSELRSAGLTPGQSEVIMRTMLELVNDLVQATKRRSVPVSAGANESYLFDAASSEVRNEIANSRLVQATAYRSGLARLQRDVEILEHEATEITSLLKSDLDIEVHERKNSARTEENVIQLKLQDLNNKIATLLNSELKSEIENLRWQITRRSLAAIAVITASIIWITQRSSSSKSAKKQVRDRQTSTLKDSPTIAVPILSPSIYEEPGSTVQTVMQLDDIVTPSAASSKDRSATDDFGVERRSGAHEHALPQSGNESLRGPDRDSGTATDSLVGAGVGEGSEDSVTTGSSSAGRLDSGFYKEHEHHETSGDVEK